jgi:type 1 fimbria pilin
MQSKGFWGMVLIAVLATGANAALAQRSREVHFRGTISDYTPQTVMPGGPWEVRGQWSLTIKRNGKADFSAALNMERSDLGVMNSGGGDLNDPTDRNAHTHQLFLCDGNVTFPAKGVIEVSGGKVTITANGGKPPFGTDNTLTIDITGGSGPNSVAFSNIKVTLGNDAEHHFGPNPLSGVVRSVRSY